MNEPTISRLKRRLLKAECWAAALAAMITDPPRARLWIPLPIFLAPENLRLAAAAEDARWWWLGVPLWRRRPLYSELKAKFQQNLADAERELLRAQLNGRAV